MCLIIQAEPGIEISRELMDDFASRNNDGFGVMWVENNKIHAEKFGPTEMDRLYPMYEQLKDKLHFIHLRMRTHGDVSAEMAHPYYCGFGIWLMHNGILPTKPEHAKEKSDTWHFINDILKPLFASSKNPHSLLRTEFFADILNRYIGSNNRIVLGDRGGFVIFNSKGWHEIDNSKTGAVGLLVSNTYAWSAQSYGKTYSYSTSGVTYVTKKDDAAPTRRRSSLFTTDEEEEQECLPRWKQHELLGNDKVNHNFFPLGRTWYVDVFGRVYKSRGWGFERRVDLDENEQFWNSFRDEALKEASEWMAENVDPSATPPQERNIILPN